jgi:hypothetical protein
METISSNPTTGSPVRTERQRRPTPSARAVAKVIRVEAAFDLASARRVLASAADLSDGTTLRVDLRRAREIHDVALAAVAAASVRVRLVGLSRHHERVLRYLAFQGPGGGSGELTME